jgi:hypothetical protein
MATEAQIAANRRNAALSTGPKSLQGKGKSRENALRHGLRATQVVALGEDGDDFAAYHAELSEALLPQDAFEAALVRRLALLSWRLDRLCRIEAAYLNADADYRARHGDGKPDAHNWPFQMPDFARYEASLDRAFKRTLTMLEQHQAARRRDALAVDTSAPPPGAVPGEGAAQNVFLPNEPNFGAPLPSPHPLADPSAPSGAGRGDTIQRESG